MKEGWEYKRLKDVATFTRGLTYSKNDEVEISNNIVLRSNNVDLSTGKLNFEELKYLKPEFSIPEEKKVKKGSLLMCMSNGSKIHLGKVALINEDYSYAFGGFMALVTPNEELNPQFFHYSLSSPEYKDFIKKLSEGANINNIKVKELELFTIPVPPLSEQQSIVDYLDSAFAKIDAMKANAEKSLNEAKALFQASLKEMLEPKEGWEECFLKDIAKYSIGLTYKPSDVCDDGTIVLRSSNIQGGKLDLNDKVRVNTKIKEELYVQNGDILMCSRNGSARLVGKVCIIPELKEKMTYGTFMMVIRSAYNPLLYHYFDTGLFRSQIKHGEANMINQITRYMLDEVKLFLPPLSEQQSIVTTLDSLKSKVDRLQANFDKISQECDALKQAILRKVFE